eukprot:TRINITY_DN13253_c0_g1_i2.p2 TRINITY_DN13253_c0_g1~~TRINITY_DN13253_c0_g1_i2.p2  ORF type:complete len:178 (-),score=67.59 TRINITY_DN13253_c0_g1_i2:261-794(-)
MLVKYQRMEGDKKEVEEKVEEAKMVAEEFRAQNSALRSEYENLKEKYTSAENNYAAEIESLKKSEKYLKEKLERNALEVERTHKERKKLKHEIGAALARCQEPVSWKGTHLDSRPSKLRLDSQLANITPIARIPECEETGEERSVTIEDKYREEQYKNKMLLVEIQNTLKNKSRCKF